MENLAHALARDELIRALTAYSGVATADGAADGSTIVDSNLIGVNDFISKKAVLVMSGPAAREDKGAASFNNVTGTIALQSGFSAQITAGTIYRVLNISSVEIDVADILTRIGTNTDAPGTTTLFAYLALLLSTGGSTFDIVNALLMLSETGGTVTTTGPGTEDNIYVDDDPAGVFKPIKVQLDFSNQTAAETVVVRTYYRIKSGGTARLKGEVTFAGVQYPPLKNIELEPNRFGIAVTIERTAGIAKAYDWCAFYEV
jgi:hypothetical protein